MNTSNQSRSFVMSAESSASSINLDHLKELSQGSMSFLETMLYAFKAELNNFLGNFEDQLMSNDFASMQKTVHKIKPTGSYIGADSLTVLVGNLEQAVKTSNRGEVSSLFAQVQRKVKTIFVEIDQQLG